MEIVKVLFLALLGISLFSLFAAIRAKKSWRVWVILNLLNLMSFIAFIVVMPSAQGYQFSVLGEQMYAVIAIVLLFAAGNHITFTVHE